MKYTYKQISKITGKKVENIRSLTHKLGIERFIVRGVTKISKEGLELLQAHYAPKISKTNNRYKIRVVENYLAQKSYREISETCRISRVTIKKIVEEWKETGYVVVDSSINFPEKFQNKGIFYRNHKWGYQFMIGGARYYKCGFDTESVAVEAMLKLKEEIRLNAK